MTDGELARIRDAYEAARTMRDIYAAKRIHVENNGTPGWDWWVGYGKDDGCQIEGTANHWRWLAMLVLGLADPADSPYTEDKPTPEVVPALLAEVDRLRARVAELEPDAARWEWYAVLIGTPGEAALQRYIRLHDDAETMHIRAAIDKAARETGEATWLS